MSRGISLSEINTQSAVIAKGELVKSAADEAAVQRHDFSRADQLSPHRKEELWSAHRRFAEAAGAELTRITKETFGFEVASIETKIYADLAALLPDPLLAAEISLSPMPNPGLILMPLDTAFALIEARACGSPSETHPDRKPSDMELVLLESVMIELLVVLKASWEELCELSPRLIGLESDYSGLHTVKGFETVVLATLNTRAGKASGRMYLCMPLFNFKSLWVKAAASDQNLGTPLPITRGAERLRLVQGAVFSPSGEGPNSRRLAELFASGELPVFQTQGRTVYTAQVR